MIDIAVLGLLEDRDLHGYELKKRFVDRLGVSSGVSFGSLYPTLARLERLGAVRSLENTSAPGPSVPQTGSLGGELAAYRARVATRHGRGRKVYRITPEGSRLFAELLVAEPEAEDTRLFGLRLAFARHLSPAGRLEMLERRRVRISEELSRAAARARAASERVDYYLESLLEHDRETLERDLDWIEGLISAERSATPALPVVGRAEVGRQATRVPPVAVPPSGPSSGSAPLSPPPSLGAVTTERRRVREVPREQVGGAAPARHVTATGPEGQASLSSWGQPRHSPASRAGNHKESR